MAFSLFDDMFTYIGSVIRRFITQQFKFWQNKQFKREKSSNDALRVTIEKAWNVITQVSDFS